jgi:hypothetical protein
VPREEVCDIAEEAEEAKEVEEVSAAELETVPAEEITPDPRPEEGLEVSEVANVSEVYEIGPK